MLYAIVWMMHFTLFITLSLELVTALVLKAHELRFKHQLAFMKLEGSWSLLIHQLLKWWTYVTGPMINQVDCIVGFDGSDMS